jgi:hypothetical protein
VGFAAEAGAKDSVGVPVVFKQAASSYRPENVQPDAAVDRSDLAAG